MSENNGDLGTRLHEGEISRWLPLVNEGAPAAGYSVCFWQRVNGRNLAFPDIAYRAVEGTSEYRAKGFGILLKALGPRTSTFLEIEDDYPNCI